MYVLIFILLIRNFKYRHYSDLLYSKIIKAFEVKICLENVFKIFLVYSNLGLGKGKSCRMSESLAPTPHNHDVNKLLKGQYYT